MTGATASYAYLHARVSVLAEQLLPTAVLERLIVCPPEQEIDLLERSGLSLSSAHGSDDPAALEQKLTDAFVADFIILARALSGVQRELLVYWARRYELSNLKAIIRGKISEQPAEKIREQLLDIGAFATLPVDDLLRTDDVAELLRMLEMTPYADIARQARRIYEEQQDQFALDAAVDRRYLAGINKRVTALAADDRRILRPLIGAILDRFNLVWLLRYRFAYNLTPAETYYLLIPGGYHLRGPELQALAQLGSFEDVMSNLPTALARELERASCTNTVDRLLELQIGSIAESILRHTAFNLARACAYLLLRELDLARIHAVLRGKRLQMKPETIRLSLWPPLTALTDAESRGPSAGSGAVSGAALG
ncbi:MAG: V-type ATPase subunit [Gammaproteobacteria bacterium]|nr:V-type ATPase subunit [Gammaproteobacteria bacterium]